MIKFYSGKYNQYCIFKNILLIKVLTFPYDILERSTDHSVYNIILFYQRSGK